MVDIALLVAEEFEKRMNRGTPSSIGGGDGEAFGNRGSFGAVTKVWGSWVESASAAVSRVEVSVALLNVEPKTGLALAAFDCFFSA